MIEIKEVQDQYTWPLRQTAMWPDRPLDYVKLPQDQEGEHFGLYLDEALVSVVSLFINGDEAQFRKFATLPEKQGLGLGTKLLKHLFDEVKNTGVKRLWCNARLDKTSFYERFGMRKIDQTFSKGGLEYVIMEYVFR